MLMFPPNLDLTDDHQASSMDLFTFLSREAEKTLRRSAGLSVPQSAYDGSRLAIPCPGTGPLRRRSSPPLHTAVKPSSSSRRKKRRRGAPSCVSASEEESPTAAAATPGAVTPLLAGGRVAASKPASSYATAQFPRLTAAPPMLSSGRCSEATLEELEERLRFFARQITSFRKTSLLYFSPEQMQRIRQMEEDNETAVRLFYCSPPSPTPSHKSSAAAAVEQPTSEFPREDDSGALHHCLFFKDVEHLTKGLKAGGESIEDRILTTAEMCSRSSKHREFKGDLIDKGLIQFCFLKIIQVPLRQAVSFPRETCLPITSRSSS
ncbi:hypothetical protein CRENBAI_020526 [Crenichthys baileyi]|uniref:Uncharacterized protein n=1 Tax=Crenichthys baileyi TaxID=28760 RepID=A0AAV9R393_9TELE